MLRNHGTHLVQSPWKQQTCASWACGYEDGRALPRSSYYDGGRAVLSTLAELMQAAPANGGLFQKIFQTNWIEMGYLFFAGY